MNQDKMHLVINNETIITVWDKEQEKYFISVVDVVSVVSESKDVRKYWNKLKQRLKDKEIKGQINDLIDDFKNMINMMIM